LREFGSWRGLLWLTYFCVAHSFAFFFFRNANWFWSGIETLLLGGSCATVAFTVGHYVSDLLGVDADELP
jgi:hypothetical protein